MSTLGRKTVIDQSVNMIDNFQLQSSPVPVLQQGPQGQLQPEAARLSGPQHEVRNVREEGDGGRRLPWQ